MEFKTLKAAAFQTAFSASPEDMLRLLAFIRFVAVEKHDFGAFAPSEIWRSWASETFVGFSSQGIMLHSGHCFAHSRISNPNTFGTAIRNSVWKPPQRIATEKRFRRFYPEWNVDAKLAGLHPHAYFRAAEAIALSATTTTTRMLEIGAGSAVHLIARHRSNSGMRSVVIDLPESICVAFATLRALLPGASIAMPHEEAKTTTDVVLRLPNQAFEGEFDFAFNMSSFQEMRIETVNAYLALMREKVFSGGLIQSLNLRRSKQFEETCIENYMFADESSQKGAPFVSSETRAAHVSAIYRCNR